MIVTSTLSINYILPRSSTPVTHLDHLRHNHSVSQLPGDICQTIRHTTPTPHKATGVNADSTDTFIDLVYANIPRVNDDLQYIFNQIYINNIPPLIKHFFSDVYLFCLHKDPTDASKLRPLGIPTAMRRIIARHVAQHYKAKFAEFLLPFNFAVGIPQGSATVINAIQLGIEKYISNNEQQGLPPTRAAVFFDLSNMFNNISRVEFLDIISASFPELIPLIQLFYDSPGAVHYKINIVKWATLFMEEGSTQGCPLSPILASLVVVRLLLGLLWQIWRDVDRCFSPRSSGKLVRHEIFGKEIFE